MAGSLSQEYASQEYASTAVAAPALDPYTVVLPNEDY
jgi:hypothetical protein